MDPTVVSRPKVNITPKITKIGNLAQSAEEIRKTSSKLRKTFEKGTYQKKTQLSVLNRYKKRLETIQKENDRKFTKKQRVKIKLPEIKKFAGSFFTAGAASDPLKSIGALAAFNALRKGAKGDVLGAIGPALVAAGIFFGPSLLEGGVNLAKGGLTRGAQPGAAPAPKPLSSGSISRANASQARFIQGKANIGDRARLVRRGYISPGGLLSKGGVEEVAKYGSAAKVGKAFGRFGKAIIPGVGAAVGAIDATMRAQEGDVTGASISGTSATLDALAAASAATGIGLPVAGLLSIASFALDVTNLVRDLSGASEKEALKNKPQEDRLKQQTEKQKALVEKKGERGTLTFGKILDRYEKVVNKFEEFSKNFRGVMGMGGEQTGVIETGNRAVPTGIELQDLEATGGESPGAPDSPYGPRRGRMHQGNDYFKPVGTPISVVQPGTVTVADMNYDPTGWGAVVEIRHPDGSLSRYAHLSKINVAPGSEVVPGQVIGLTGGAAGAPGSGNSEGPHLHFEYENASGRVDPTSVAPKIFRFGGNVRVKQSGQQPSRLSPEAQQIQQTGTYTVAGVTYDVKTGAPVTSTPQISRSPRPARGIQYYPSYDSRGQMDQVIPIPIPVQQQQMSQGQSSSPMMLSGPSEQELLNSFYKRVLLNTVA
jgi:murein DD-endopeptidase MepM/ murein hydrolase activator NlpD